jgi:uncharacterized protein YdeI (YjbR/CyaY-like superfamily)
MKVCFFKTPDEFRNWLEVNSETMTELWVGYYKLSTGKPSVTYSNALDEALCYGWIDGLRKSIDESSYCIRFTPRKPRSIWSAVNINKVEELIKIGKMRPQGLAAFEKRSDSRSGIYSYENRPETLDPMLEACFREHQKAWEFFIAQPPSYKKSCIFNIMSGKQEATKISRLEKLIEACEIGKRLF